MQPGGTLTGTVTDAATAKPLAGICVGDDDGDFAVTGKDGTYKIDQLPAERTTVRSAVDAGTQGSYAPQYLRRAGDAGGRSGGHVTAGHVTAGINAAMLPGATLAGRVTNSAGRPVRGVCIGIVPADESGLASSAATPETSSSGAYVRPTLRPAPTP